MSLSINLDTSSMKTSVPIIADGHLCKVRFANVKQSTVEGKGDVLAFEFHLLDAAPTIEGTQVKPGFFLFDRVYLYGKDTAPGQIPDMAIKKISKIQDALLGTGDPDEIGQPAGTINKKGKPVRPAFNDECVAVLIGKETYLKVKVKTGEYEGNEVSSYTFPGDLKA